MKGNKLIWWVLGGIGAYVAWQVLFRRPVNTRAHCEKAWDEFLKRARFATPPTEEMKQAYINKCMGNE